MTLDEYYNRVFEDTISKDEEIMKYEKDLASKEKELNERTIHPGTVVKTMLERKKLMLIKSAYYKLRNSSLIESVREEDGELGNDLEWAATSTKPERLREFIHNNKIIEEKKGKKLLKTRK